MRSIFVISTLFAGALALLGILSAFAETVDLLPGRWRPKDASRIGCYRDWFAAVSGYVAAAFAGLSLLYLNKQIIEQAKQSAFLLGEADPTLDVYSEGSSDTFIRVVNWNRRTFVIDKIECDVATKIYVISAKIQHHEWVEVLQSSKPEFFPAIRVAAFDDRSQAPAICRIKFKVIRQGDIRVINGTFRVHGRLLGDSHLTRVLKATAQIHTVPTRTKLPAASIGAQSTAPSTSHGPSP